jgi:hypothetical protein
MEDVLERPILSHDNPESLVQNRNEMMKEYYGGVKDQSAMIEQLNKKVTEIEHRHDRGEAENVKEVPDISLSREKDWREFGWNERDKAEV